jgi:uncharacterized protein YbjT (DUF2867 family)
MGIRAVLFGATGMVGEGVLHEALKNDLVESVLVIGRRPCNVTHLKLREILHNNFFDYTILENRLAGYNACFFCLGVTSIGKKEDEYRRLTFDLTLAAAKVLSRLNPDMVFCYVSGAGTDSSECSRTMWARIKGKTENDLQKLPFKAAYAFRPGYIRPTPGLKNAFAFAKILSPLYPVVKQLFGKYVCTLEDVGLSMIHAAAFGYHTRILECEDIARLAGGKSVDSAPVGNRRTFDL